MIVLIVGPQQPQQGATTSILTEEEALQDKWCGSVIDYTKKNDQSIYAIKNMEATTNGK
jgi:hypothetical protein